MHSKIKEIVPRGNGQQINESNINDSLVIQAGGDVHLDADFFKELIDSASNKKLINNLLDEKIETCKEQIILLNIEKAQAIINTVDKYGFEAVDSYRKSYLAYMGFIIAWKDTNKVLTDKFRRLITESVFLEEIKLIEEISNGEDLTKDRINTFEVESQALIMLRYFESHNWKQIIDLYESIYIYENKQNVPIFYNYLYALSCINLQEYNKAESILELLSSNMSDDRFKFYKIVARILETMNMDYSLFAGQDDAKKELRLLYNQLKSFENSKVYKSNPTMMAQIKLNLALFIDELDVNCLWNEFDETIRQSQDVKSIYIRGLYSNGQYEEAISVIKSIPVKDNNFDIIEMSCMVNLGHNIEAENFYRSLGSKTTAELDSLYLVVIKNTEPNKYRKELETFINKYGNNVRDIYYLAITISDADIFKEDIIDKITVEDILRENYRICLGYGMVFAKHNFLKAANVIFSSIDIRNLRKEILDELFINIQKSSDSIDKETLINILLEQGVKELDLYKEKTNYLIRNSRFHAALLCAKKVYASEPIASHADVIISLMRRIPITDLKEYKEYSDIILSTKNPKNISNLALGYMISGDTGLASELMYRAMYYLDGKFNADIYMSYFNVAIFSSEPVKNTGNNDDTVIELKDGFHCFKLCIDSEEDLDDIGNYSFGVEHVSKKDYRRNVLLDKKVGEKVILSGNEYEITSIQPREFFVFRYVSDKLSNGMQQTRLIQVSVSEDPSQDIIQRLKMVSDSFNKGCNKKDTQKELLDEYINLNGDIVKSIELLALNDYSCYVKLIEILLYKSDYALYAGQANCHLKSEKYVLSLSTLVLLAEFKAFSFFEPIKDKFIIPTTLKDFILKQKDRFGQGSIREGGRLVETDDNSMVLLTPDKTEGELWNDIYDFCCKIEVSTVSIEDRAAMEITPDLKAEQLFSKLNVDICQFDSLVLASKEHITYLSDDLFFRNIATICRVDNNNLAFLIMEHGQMDPMYAEQLAIKISTTNYIYPPVIFNSFSTFNDITKNMLDGKMKRKYNSQIILNHIFNENCDNDEQVAE